MARNLLLGTALQTGLTCMTALAALPAVAQPAPNARPTGGAVVAGAAAISQSVGNTRITQSTQRAAIDWKSFDVGSQQSVTFSQPSASAVALNRVTGPDPSQIAGRIDANGQIILLNQSGVNFYQGAQVNAAGVMISTIGASDQSVKSFVASTTGKLSLDQPGNPNAKVDNRGTITIRQAGLAALVAPQVANSGTIAAKLGHVVLAGAKTATLDLYGDGLLSLDVTNQVTQAPAGATALVTNTGVIIADGGTVQLTARAADGIVQNLVQAGGTIRAATMGGQTGTVALNGVGGSIVVEGQLAVPGTAPGTKGGTIVANATGTVTLLPTAMLNASGRAGGGTVAVGTTLARAAGGPGVTPTLTAANVMVQKGATIAADATGKGKGGRVTVLSTGTTAMAGAISAKGGPKGGDGGFVETSGNTLQLGRSAMVDTRAPQGRAGTWLIDPIDWTIANSGGDETPAEVVIGLKTTNITIQANNDITVTDPINAKSDALATNSLIFQAGRSILVNASITMNGGSFTATANDSADLGTSLDRRSGAGDFTMAGGVTIDTSVGSHSISIAVGPAAPNTDDGANFDPGAITLVNLTTSGGGVTVSGGTGLALSGNVNAGAGTVTLTPAGQIIQSGGTITAATLDGSATGGVFLTSQNNIVALGPFNTASQLFVLDDSNAASLTVNSLTAGTIGLTAPVINIPGVINGDSVNLTATGGGISEAGGSITSTVLFGSATGAVDLTGTNNISTLNGFTATGQAFTLLDNAGLTLFGDVTAATVNLTAPTIAITTPLTGTTSVMLTATQGAITESAVIDGDQFTGTITTPLLTGSGATSATLDTPSNLINNLGKFTTSGDLTLVTATSLTVVGTVSAGGASAPDPANIATVTLTAFGGLQIGVSAGTPGIINAGTVALSAFGGSITEPNGTIGTNSLAASANTEGSADVLLTSTSNQIAASTGITAANGNVALVDDPTLLLTGSYTGNNLFFEVTQPGGSLQLGDEKTPAALTVPGGLISLIADNMSVGNAGSSIVSPGGTLELAPFSPIHESVAGSNSTSQLLVDATLLSIIGSGEGALDTLVIGGFTNQPANTPLAASATGVTLDGPIDLANQASTLNLLANGSITEPGGPLTVANVVGKSIGAFSLANPANAVAQSTGITATNGDVVVVDGSDLHLFGTQSGNNLLFEVARNGGTLTLGNADRTVSLTAGTGDRIGLVADQISQTNRENRISVPGGTLELAPFSPINTSLNGNNAVGQLLIDPALLSIVSPAINTLVIGGFTNEPAGAGTSSPSAGSVTIDGLLSLAPLATTLDLEAIGAVTQSAPILNVGTLLGTTGSAILGTHLNSVASLGAFSASSGPVILNDDGVGGKLTVNGPVTGASVTIQNAPSISVVGSISAGTTVAITSGAGGIMVATGGIITGPTIDLNGGAGGIALTGNAPVGQPGGIVDLTASGVGVSEAGTSIIIAGTLQSSGSVAGPVTLTNANRVASIGSFLVTGAGDSFTLVDAAGVNLGVSGPLSAAQDVALSTSGFGAVTATGGIAAGRTLSVTSGSGGISLATGAVLTGPTIDLNGAAGGIAMSGKASVGQAGGLVDLTTTGGGVTEAATATVTAGILQSAGGIIGNVALPGIGNAIATLGSLTVSGGTFGLNDTGDLNVTGQLTASDVTIGDVGTLTVSNRLVATGTASLTAAGIIIPGLVSAGSVVLSGTTGSVDEAGSLIAGTLSGSATGAATLTGINQVGALGDFSAGSFALNDRTDLLIEGTLNAARIAILAPASQISLGDGATIVTGGTARPPGPIQTALEPSNGGPGALLQAASFAQVGTSTVLGQGGGPATLQISTTGNAQFDPPLGLAATSTWLILNLTNGTAAGNVFVNALDVTYTVPGSTNLFGTIDAVGGGRAASLGFIQPAIDPHYLFNGCIIAAAQCTNVSLNTGLTATLGAIYPLLSITPPALTNLPDLVLIALPMLQPPPPQLTDPDVVPPNITYLDY